jgi:O-glycosyl hydrolase
MVINKQPSTAATATVNISSFAHRGTTQVWQLTAANAITRLADVGISGTNFVATLPAQSVTLFVVAKNVSAPTPPTNLRIIK